MRRGKQNGRAAVRHRWEIKFMRTNHFCDCGPHFHCGNPIVFLVCEECGNEYLGADCEVTRPLPVSVQADGRILCKDCAGKEGKSTQLAV